VPLDVQLDYDRGIPVHRQIYEAVARALASRRLGSSEQLPTIHDLASRLGINPNTVVRAYKDLERDGYIVARRGLGTFTSPHPPGAKASDAVQESLLRSIYERAMVEAATHHISPKQVVRFFRRALNDE
jgi:GntR family transcriptional regulator